MIGAASPIVAPLLQLTSDRDAEDAAAGALDLAVADVATTATTAATIATSAATNADLRFTLYLLLGGLARTYDVRRR